MEINLNAQNLSYDMTSKEELVEVKNRIDRKLQDLKAKKLLFDFDNINVSFNLNGY